MEKLWKFTATNENCKLKLTWVDLTKYQELEEEILLKIMRYLQVSHTLWKKTEKITLFSKIIIQEILENSKKNTYNKKDVSLNIWGQNKKFLI